MKPAVAKSYTIPITAEYPPQKPIRLVLVKIRGKYIIGMTNQIDDGKIEKESQP